MTSGLDPLPSDLASAHAMILVERAARVKAEAVATSTNALIAHLRLEIEKLRRALYGSRSERKRRLLEQLERKHTAWAAGRVPCSRRLSSRLQVQPLPLPWQQFMKPALRHCGDAIAADVRGVPAIALYSVLHLRGIGEARSGYLLQGVQPNATAPHLDSTTAQRSRITAKPPTDPRTRAPS